MSTRRPTLSAVPAPASELQVMRSAIFDIAMTIKQVRAIADLLESAPKGQLHEDTVTMASYTIATLAAEAIDQAEGSD